MKTRYFVKRGGFTTSANGLLVIQLSDAGCLRHMTDGESVRAVKGDFRLSSAERWVEEGVWIEFESLLDALAYADSCRKEAPPPIPPHVMGDYDVVVW